MKKLFLILLILLAPALARAANSYNVLDNSVITGNNYVVTKTAPSISSNTLTLDLNAANVFAVALTSAITTMTVSNISASGLTSSFQLMFTADGSSRAVTYMSGIVWSGGTTPTLTTTNAKRDWLQFITFDGGTTWFGFVLGQNF